MAKRPIIMKALMKMPNGAHTHEEALEALKNGQPIVFPTDTLFGLGVSVLHAPNPDILYAIKHREKKKPIAWLVGGIEDLERYGKMVPDFAFALARTFWPGPLTVIVKASDEVRSEAFCMPEDDWGTKPSSLPGICSESEYPCCYSALPTELRLVMRILTSSVISRMPSLAGFLGSKQAGFSAM